MSYSSSRTVRIPDNPVDPRHLSYSPPNTGPLQAGRRAEPGLVGNKKTALTVINQGDPLPLGWTALWDGSVLRINGSDVVIDMYDIRATVDCYGTNLTVTNSTITGSLDAYWGIHSRAGVLTVTDVTIIGPNNTAAVGGIVNDAGSMVVTRTDVSGYGDLIDAIGPCTISQCVLHGPALVGGNHCDGVQYYGGFGLVIEHSWIDTGSPNGDSTDGSHQNSGIYFDTTSSTATENPRIDNNYLHGGAYALYTSPAQSCSGAVITNNDFGPVSNGLGEVSVDHTDYVTWSNNRKADGTLIPAP
jgi:hypothetical protein